MAVISVYSYSDQVIKVKRMFYLKDEEKVFILMRFLFFCFVCLTFQLMCGNERKPIGGDKQ